MSDRDGEASCSASKSATVNALGRCDCATGSEEGLDCFVVPACSATAFVAAVDGALGCTFATLDALALCDCATGAEEGLGGFDLRDEKRPR